MSIRTGFAIATVSISMFAAGCAQDGSLTTGSISSASLDPKTAGKVDPACVTLASKIDTLNKDGVSDKVSKAAAKKYKMKSTDIAKADQLNKANAEFRAKCSTVPMLKAPQTAEAGKTKDSAKAKKTAAKQPPVPPAKKPVATAAATPQTTATPSPQP